MQQRVSRIALDTDNMIVAEMPGKDAGPITTSSTDVYDSKIVGRDDAGKDANHILAW